MYPTYVYILSEPRWWTVGFYDADEKWHAESDHDSRKSAATRVAYLNAGHRQAEQSEQKTTEILDAVRDSLDPEKRNVAKDQELATFWADWLETNAAMLREIANDADNSP